MECHNLFQYNGVLCTVAFHHLYSGAPGTEVPTTVIHQIQAWKMLRMLESIEVLSLKCSHQVFASVLTHRTRGTSQEWGVPYEYEF